MQNNNDSQKQSLLIDPQNASYVLPWLEKLIGENGKYRSQLLEFVKDFAINEFNLGDDIFNLPSSFNGNGQTEGNSNYLWVICQGKVRILSLDTEKRREVCTQVLEEGDIFGTDSLFIKDYFSYRALSADNNVIVAKIHLDRLRPWLEQISPLPTKLNATVKLRQTLIFFKTLTILRSVSNHKLQQIVPMLRELRVPAREPIVKGKQITGRFWLRSGEIENHIIDIGSSWGYPESKAISGTAHTDLSIYLLPREDWQTACEIAPILAETYGKGEILAKNSNKVAIPKVKTKAALIAPPPHIVDRPVSPPPSPERSQSSSTKELPKVDFPKPRKLRRRWWDRYPHIEQQSAADCGPTCLCTISQYWGKNFSLNSVKELANVGRSGATLKNLAKAAELIGYEARPVRASLSSLETQKNPWIAHWGGDHYIVVYQVKGDRVLVADPALAGKEYYPRQKFLDGWTGYALLVNPTEKLALAPESKQSLSRFIGLLTPYHSVTVQIILTSVLIQLFGIVSPLFTQIILDQVVVSKSLSSLHVFSIGALIFGIWSIALTGVRQYLLSYLSNRLDLTMIGGFIRHTLMLPLKFFETRHVGDIITRVQENQKIQRFLLNQVVLAWLDFLSGIIYLGLMLWYNWQLTLLVIALIPPIILTTLGATPLLRKVSKDIFNKSAEQNSALVETITGIDTVKATAAERELRWRWEERLTGFLNAQFRGQKLGINIQTIGGLINSVGSTALLWYGALLVIQGQLTIGQFVAFNMLISKVLQPVLSLSNLWDELQEVMISVERLDDVFSEQPEETAEQHMLVLPQLRGDIIFDNVTFSYGSEEDRNTLQNLSFDVKRGQTIAIVGRSGSGKSTLVKLLEGLYRPSNGKIWIDGHDLEHISPQSFRSQIGVVPQDCYLFSGTILENITLYRPEYTLEQAIEASRLAEAHAFIQAMPLGYNTKVGERGANLSGGQRQRIAIARALLGEPKILILDEATSSLDTESERRFQENLDRLSRDRTTFIIAHRLSTVRDADLILVLDRGVLIEKGNHDQLMMNSNGLYYHLAKQQLAL